MEFQTASGQMIDLITTIEGEKDLSKYSLPLWVQNTKSQHDKRKSSLIDEDNYLLPLDFLEIDCFTYIIKSS